VSATCLLIAIQREEEKVKRSLKDAAKKGDKDVCRILAKEVIRAKKSVSKIHSAKAQLKSVEYNMNQQLGECWLNCYICLFFSLPPPEKKICTLKFVGFLYI